MPKSSVCCSIPACHRNAVRTASTHFVRVPGDLDLSSRDRAATAAVIVLAAMRGQRSDDTPVATSAAELAELTGWSAAHLRARVLKPWEQTNVGPVSVTALTQRRKLYTVSSDPNRFTAFPGCAVGLVEGRPLIVLAALCRHLYDQCGADRAGSFVAPYRDLTDQLRMDDHTITRAIAELERAGLLDVHRGTDTNGVPLPNRYRITRWDDFESRVGRGRSRASGRAGNCSESRVGRGTYETYEDKTPPTPQRLERRSTPTPRGGRFQPSYGRIAELTGIDQPERYLSGVSLADLDQLVADLEHRPPPKVINHPGAWLRSRLDGLRAGPSPARHAPTETVQAAGLQLADLSEVSRSQPRATRRSTKRGPGLPRSTNDELVARLEARAGLR